MTVGEHARRHPEVWRRFSPRQTLIRYAWYVGIVFVAVRPLAPGVLFAGFIAAQLVTFAGLLLRDKHEELVGNNKNGE